MATVSGVWVWNSYPSFGNPSSSSGWHVEQNVNFTCNGSNFSEMTFYGESLMGARNINIKYDESAVYNYAEDRTGEMSGGWTNETYRTVDFGSTPQTVSDDFFEYLENYATPPAEPVPTPDWANCFVKTSGGNKAVEKVWIKQNGQLVTVWDGGGGGGAAVDFATDSWETISAACKDGSYKTVYKVGDTKDITLSTGETITVAIMGFDHDDLSDGSGKAPITVAMENLLATKYPMNSRFTNDGGWNDCLMRTSTMATLLTQLPSDLQSVIKQVNKKATEGGRSETITTSADKLWLFALSEIFSATSIENSSTSNIAYYADTYNAEGTQYKYYENLIGDNNGGTGSNSLLTKKLSNGGGSIYAWWTRSPYVAGSMIFNCIASSGDGSNAANDLLGVCFGFCVG